MPCPFLRPASSSFSPTLRSTNVFDSFLRYQLRSLPFNLGPFNRIPLHTKIQQKLYVGHWITFQNIRIQQSKDRHNYHRNKYPYSNQTLQRIPLHQKNGPPECVGLARSLPPLKEPSNHIPYIYPFLNSGCSKRTFTYSRQSSTPVSYNRSRMCARWCRFLSNFANRSFNTSNSSRVRSIASSRHSKLPFGERSKSSDRAPIS